MMTPPLTGPSVVPPDPTHALICLHGFGASGDDLVPLAHPLQEALGKVLESGEPLRLALFSPDAPQPTPFGEGRQWFDAAGWSFKDEKGLKAGALLLEGYFQHLHQTHGIPFDRMAVLGFSQGAMLALYALPSWEHPPAGLMAHSGGLSLQPALNEAHPTVPLLFLHGRDDDVWPADYTVAAAQFYQQHGYPVQLELLEGLGHGIDARSLAHMTLFLGELWKVGGTVNGKR